MKSADTVELVGVLGDRSARFANGVPAGFTRGDAQPYDEPVADPREDNPQQKKKHEKEHGRQRKLGEHDKGLVAGSGDHAAHDGPKTDHAMHVEAYIHKGTQTAGR